ncbi:MAG: DUF5615 family PIN-like protein [Thermomicrobiaceae bacterium]|nr:DUF5615 family PIN-like protein [Thermomicrobiaceae bacterium]
MRPIPFLIDENVPASVGDFLRQRGHHVLAVGESLPKGSPDHLLTVTAEREGLVIVTFDRDFRRLIKTFPEGSRGKWRRAGRISLACREPEALSRIQELIDVIEFSYARALERRGRLIMRISQTSYDIVG